LGPEAGDDAERAMLADAQLSNHLSLMSEALKAVIDENRFEDVGDFVIEAAQRTRGFRYREAAGAIAGLQPPVIRSIPGVLTSMHVGGAAEGAFIYSFMEGHRPEAPGGEHYPAIYFATGRFGYLYKYDPVDALKPTVIAAGSNEEFVRACERDHGVRLEGIWAPSTP
jgi:hypothetical protein